MADLVWSDAVLDAVQDASKARGVVNSGGATLDVLAALSVYAVPRAAVLDLAQQWEDGWESSTDDWRDSQDCATELRALAGGDE